MHEVEMKRKYMLQCYAINKKTIWQFVDKVHKVTKIQKCNVHMLQNERFVTYILVK